MLENEKIMEVNDEEYYNSGNDCDVYTYDDNDFKGRKKGLIGRVKEVIGNFLGKFILD